MAIGTPVDLGFGDGTGTSDTVTMTTAAGSGTGDRIVVWVTSSLPLRALSTVTDSRGNTYTIHLTQNSAATTGNLYIASAAATTALQTGDTITATFASAVSSVRQMAAVAVSGAGALNGTPGGRTDVGGSDANTGTVTTTVANSIVLGGTACGAAATMLWDAPAIELHDFATSTRSLATAYDIKGSSGTYGFTGVVSAGTTKQEGVVAFEDAPVDPSKTGAETVAFGESATVAATAPDSVDAGVVSDSDTTIEDPGSTIEGTLSETAEITQEEAATDISRSDTFGVSDTATVVRTGVRPDTNPPTDFLITPRTTDFLIEPHVTDWSIDA